MRAAVLAGCLLVAICGDAVAHRLSPAFFGLTQISDLAYRAQWKVSISGGLADTLEPQIPDGCAIDGVVRNYTVADARVVHATLGCEGPLTGREFVVEGLAVTDTDVLFRIDYLDGASFTHRLVPDAPAVLIPEQPGAIDVITTYLVLGVEHILLGIDHLLFVLALLLIVSGWRRLVATVTAFTIAHSITLGAAALGFVTVPGVPVEATIALSILFLATEIARGHTDRARVPAEGRSEPMTLTQRFPWLVAFTFGLLHGFGFAGALNEIGLPEQAIPLALLFFNVGVELGQLAFIAAVLVMGAVLRQIALAPPRWAPRATAYVIGSVAAFWVFERTLLAI